MTRAYVLDPTTLATLGLVDQSWERLTYTRRYFGMDTFQMTIQRARLYADQLTTGRLLYLPDEGDRIFLIEQVTSLAEGSSANDLMTVSGRSMEGITMVERIVIPPAGQDYDKQTAVPAETAIKHYVALHAQPGVVVDANRGVPNFNVPVSAGTGTSVTVAGRYQTVFDLVNQIGLLAGMGWEIVFNPATSKFDFKVINGVDRSTSVFFDFAFETLEKWEELDSILESKTFAIIAGQGEGKDRDIVTRPASAIPTGMARREAFLDARDIDLGATTELTQRADSFLAAATKVTRLEAGIHQYGAFRYGTHWDMGDLVLIRNEERGISYTARVVEVEKSFDQSMAAPTVTAIIDRPFPTMKEQINGAGASPGAVDYPDTLNPKLDTIVMDRINADIKIARGGAGQTLQTTNGVGAIDTRTTLEATSGRRVLLDLRVAGDSASRLAAYGDATLAGIELGSGAGARDVNLYRSAANILKTDDAFHIGAVTDVTLSSTDPPLMIGPSSGQNIAMDGNEIMARSNGATSPLALQADGGRLTINANSAPTTNADGLLFGADVTLFRAGANILRTDDDFQVGDPATSGLHVRASGGMELFGATPYLDFKNASGDDFDARLILNTNDQLELAGSVLTADMMAPDSVSDQSGTDAVTVTTAGTYYAVGAAAEVSFTPSFVGQRFLILATYAAYADGTGIITGQVNIRDGSNGAIATVGYSRHEVATSSEWGPGAVVGVWTADAVATRKIKLYVTHSTSGRIVNGAFYQFVALPIM